MDIGIEVKYTSVCAGVGGRERRNNFTEQDNRSDGRGVKGAAEVAILTESWAREIMVKAVGGRMVAAETSAGAGAVGGGGDGGGVSSGGGKRARTNRGNMRTICKGACARRAEGQASASTTGEGAAKRANQTRTTRYRQISRSSSIDPSWLLPRHKSILVPRLFLIGLHASPKGWQQASLPPPRATAAP